MPNYIYVGGECDILIDADGGFDEKNARHVMRIAGLTIQHMEIRQSRSPGCYHVLIRVDRALPVVERIALAALCGSDTNREALALNGAARGQKEPMLLISDKEWTHLTPVSICECTKRPCKHVQRIQPRFTPLKRPHYA